MTITLKADQEKAIQAAIEAGVIRSVDEWIDAAIARLPGRAQHCPSASEARNLVELFENSPFKGLSIDFHRDQDYGREIDL